MLAQYVAGTAAVAATNYTILAATLLRPRSTDDDEELRIPTIGRVNIGTVLYQDGLAQKALPPMDPRRQVASEHLLTYLENTLAELIPSRDQLVESFEILEYLMALTYVDLVEGDARWAPVGRFLWRRRKGGRSPAADFIAEGLRRGARWELFQVGFFRSSAERLRDVEKKLAEECLSRWQ